MFKVLQPSSRTCNKACPNVIKRAAQCNRNEACPGYGTSEACPPLIVIAVVDYAQRALAAATLPAFGSMRTVTA